MIPVARIIDQYVGNCIIFFLSFFKKNYKKGKIVIFIRLWTLGESLLTLPTIKKLVDDGFDVTVLCTKRNKVVFEASGIDIKIELLSFKNLFLFKKFDLSIDSEPYLRISGILSFLLAKSNIGYLNGSFRDKIYFKSVKYNDQIHTTEMIARLIMPVGIKFKPKELVPLKRKSIQRFMKKFKGKFIGIHAGGAESAQYRFWPKEKFRALIMKLVSKGYNIFLTGTKMDFGINKDISNGIIGCYNVAGKFQLDEFADFLSRLDIFISNDTGPMHLSAAMGCKTIGLFGPNLPKRFGPFPLKNNGFLYKGEVCSLSPCINVHKGSFPKCPYDGKCMKAITVREVFEKVEGMV